MSSQNFSNQKFLEYISLPHLGCTFMDDGITRERDYLLDLWYDMNTNSETSSQTRAKIEGHLSKNLKTPDRKRERDEDKVVTNDNSKKPKVTCNVCKLEGAEGTNYECIRYPTCDGSFCNKCADEHLGFCTYCDQQMCYTHVTDNGNCEDCNEYIKNEKK